LIVNDEIVVGIDEAGRGCLAGPVYAAAVILNPNKITEEFNSEIRDSKKLSEHRRQRICQQLLADHRVGVGFATVEEITSMNILNAALLAMKRAFENLNLDADELKKCHVMVDGNQKIKNFLYKQTTVIKGDQKIKAISAASIVAKVNRDNVLHALHEKYPQFGYNEHKGYGTETHRKAIASFGPTEHHRPTFSGVKEYL
jgi:ribonuclease HII